MAQAKSAQDDFNVNGIFWHYCARCQWEMGGWGLNSQLYSKRRWLFLKVFLQSSLLKGEQIIASQCLKIVQKVAFNIASEASYVYNLTRQKLIKNGPFWRVFCGGQTVLPDI